MVALGANEIREQQARVASTFYCCGVDLHFRISQFMKEFASNLEPRSMRPAH
jgi:hypothetical protein